MNDSVTPTPCHLVYFFSRNQVSFSEIISAITVQVECVCVVECGSVGDTFFMILLSIVKLIISGLLIIIDLCIRDIFTNFVFMYNLNNISHNQQFINSRPLKAIVCGVSISPRRCQSRPGLRYLAIHDKNQISISKKDNQTNRINQDFFKNCDYRLVIDK